ncbi:MAG: hypothetical protein ABL933_05430 [Methyloglobulus sp.]
MKQYERQSQYEISPVYLLSALGLEQETGSLAIGKSYMPPAGSKSLMFG